MFVSSNQIVSNFVSSNDMNIIRIPEELLKNAKYLKREFGIKDLRKTKNCLSLQIDYKTNEVLIHHFAYIEKILKQFNMDNNHC